MQQIPDWIVPFVIAQATAFVGWCVRVEIRQSKTEAKTEAFVSMQKETQEMLVSMRGIEEQIKMLFRLVEQVSDKVDRR